MLSSTGYARDLIRLALRGNVVLVTSTYVLQEVAANLAKKAPAAAVLFDQVLQEIEWQMVEPSPEDILDATDYTVLKDARVVAAAKKAACDYLATYDRKHLLEPPDVAQQSGLTIVTPDVVVMAVQDNDND